MPFTPDHLRAYPVDRRRLSHFHQARTNLLWRYVRREAPTIEKFLRNRTAEIAIADLLSHSLLHDRLGDVSAASDRLPVDRVGRFEGFGWDLKEILARMGIDH